MIFLFISIHFKRLKDIAFFVLRNHKLTRHAFKNTFPFLFQQKCSIFVILQACIGDSITSGVTLLNPRRDSYPSLLQKMLGDGYEVRNFGVLDAAARYLKPFSRNAVLMGTCMPGHTEDSSISSILKMR